MAGDYTRFTFEPTKGFSGLHKQQGRVSLDSEFNEFEEILDRHTRSEMYDTVGQAVYPTTTPTAFQIGVTAGQLTIGIGRMYVDGIQAECFGDMTLATVFDPNVGGVVGSGTLLYDQQPFFYQPNFPALSPTPGDINLVYLDVWQREVTMFEDDALREVALNGPDTATRVQTAWQVKALFPADANSCSTPPATWATITAPSTARLTTVLAPAVPSGGPCVINPTGGYIGIENRLYRVEIQRAGTLGGVGPARGQFKWSRDNASLAARVLSIVAGPVAGQSIITVASTGRDSWTRFEPGNEIELLDDYVEYAMRETGRGGDMASVLAVNHATGEITIDTDLSAFVISAARHPRIRRWDTSLSAPTPLRDVDNVTAFALEDGISVLFGSGTTDTLHAGDFWVFAARTATGSIDILVDATPRGILHHYARLALVSSSAPPVVMSDCRTPWPPDTGCCTAVVRPGESIQAAINSLPPAGGCVCLKAGIHNISATIWVDRSNVHMHGESEGAEVRVAAGVTPALAIAPPGAGRLDNVMVEHLRIVQPDSFGFGFIYSEDVDHLAIRDVDMLLTYTGQLPAFNIGIYIENASDVLLEANTVTNTMWGIVLGEIAVRCQISGNTLIGPAYSLAPFSRPFGEFGIQFASQSAGIHRLERNAIVNYLTGIAMLENATAATIANNRIRRPIENAFSTDTFPLTPALLRAYLDSPERFYAIDLRGGGRYSRVHDNQIELESDYFGGIRVQIDQVLVRANLITSTLPPSLQTMPPAIYCGALSTGANATGCTVIDNIVQGPTTGIIVSLSVGVAVTNNRVDGQGRGWYAVRLDDCAYTTVTGTLVAAVPLPFVCTEGDHNVLRNNRAAFALVGLGVTGEAEFTFDDNEITGAIFGGVLGIFEYGNCSLSRNRIVNCGQLAFGPVQGGIIAMSAWPVYFNLNTLRIESCEVIESGVGPDGKVGTGNVTGIQAWFPNCHIIGNRVIATNTNVNPALEHRAMQLIGPINAGVDLLRARGTSALVSGNKFCGYGLTHLVELWHAGNPLAIGMWFDKIVFSSNVCDHILGRDATVLLGGRAAAIAANTVVGTPGLPSISGDSFAEGTATANATTGAIDQFVSITPAPETNFNIRI